MNRTQLTDLLLQIIAAKISETRKTTPKKRCVCIVQSNKTATHLISRRILWMEWNVYILHNLSNFCNSLSTFWNSYFIIPPYSKPLQNKLRISFKTYWKKLQYGTAEHNWEAIHCPCADGNKAHQQKTRQIKEPMKQATELPACHPHRWDMQMKSLLHTAATVPQLSTSRDFVAPPHVQEVWT